jgi:serine/threonine protein kinase
VLRGQDDHPVLPDSISMDMQDFLLLCFQKDPQRRPGAKSLLGHSWLRRQRSTLRASWSKTAGLRARAGRSDAYISVTSVVERILQVLAPSMWVFWCPLKPVCLILCGRFCLSASQDCRRKDQRQSFNSLWGFPAGSFSKQKSNMELVWQAEGEEALEEGVPSESGSQQGDVKNGPTAVRRDSAKSLESSGAKAEGEQESDSRSHATADDRSSTLPSGQVSPIAFQLVMWHCLLEQGKRRAPMRCFAIVCMQVLRSH